MVAYNTENYHKKMPCKLTKQKPAEIASCNWTVPKNSRQNDIFVLLRLILDCLCSSSQKRGPKISNFLRGNTVRTPLGWSGWRKENGRSDCQRKERNADKQSTTQRRLDKFGIDFADQSPALTSWKIQWNKISTFDGWGEKDKKSRKSWVCKINQLMSTNNSPS